MKGKILSAPSSSHLDDLVPSILGLPHSPLRLKPINHEVGLISSLCDLLENRDSWWDFTRQDSRPNILIKLLRYTFFLSLGPSKSCTRTSCLLPPASSSSIRSVSSLIFPTRPILPLVGGSIRKNEVLSLFPHLHKNQGGSTGCE